MAESPRKGQEGNVVTRKFGPRLCDYCDKAFRAFDDEIQTSLYSQNDFRKSDYHPTLLSLLNAVRSGCQLCIMLEHQIREHHYYHNYHKEGRSDKDLKSDRILEEAKWRQPVLVITGFPDIHLQITLWFDDGFLVGLEGKYNYTPPGSTDSLPAWELCRSWIDSCIESHEACKGPHPSSDSQWWPTRLLYIGSLGDKDFGDDDLTTLNIQLHKTQDNPPIGPYMTLSHCWGVSGEMLKLTVDTYEHRIKNGFSYAELPKTFQDAVRLSRFLRGEYIWIDSLCIIQDSHDDWIRESKMMANRQHPKGQPKAVSTPGILLLFLLSQLSSDP
ncbi:hypothetical protein Hte_004137 [Hypoxylon texense]